MSARITFRYVPATGNPNDSTYRTSYWVNTETGVELRKGIDDGGIEWVVWTAGMGKPLASGCATLGDARSMGRFIITDRKEWLA